MFNFFKRKQNEVKTNEETCNINKLWDLWDDGKIDSPYNELMTYQSEINNGGHDQYFTNVVNTGDLEKEMSALEQILSAKLKSNLKKAYKAYLVLEEKENDEKAEESLENCDDIFYDNEKEINAILESYCLQIGL